jgi:O-antigen ligase
MSPFYFMWNSLLTSGQLGFTTKVSPLDVLAGLSLLYGVIALSRSNFRPSHVLDWACLAWVSISFIALSHGVLEGYEAAFRSSRGALLWVLYFPAVLLVTLDERRRRETWRVILAAAALTGGIDLLASLGALTALFPTLPVGVVGGVFIRPNFFGDPALMIPSIVLVLTLLAVGRWSSGQRFYLAALATLDLAVLMISVTRGFWLGMFAALIVFIGLVVWKRTLTKRALAVGVVGSLGAVSLVEVVVFLWRRTSLVGALVERSQALLTGDPLGVDVRLAESAAYLNSFLQAPALGNGYGAPVHFSATAEKTGFAHNQYLFVLQTTGLVGFCALGALLVLVVWLALRAVWRVRALSEAHITPVFVCATFVGFGVTSAISPEFTNVTTVPLLAVATALIRAGRTESARRGNEPSRGSRG